MGTALLSPLERLPSFRGSLFYVLISLNMLYNNNEMTIKHVIKGSYTVVNMIIS